MERSAHNVPFHPNSLIATSSVADKPGRVAHSDHLPRPGIA